jgi:hypothetical protein
MMVTVLNATRGSRLCRVEVANSFMRRALGLMLRRPERNIGLLIEFSSIFSSRTIHSFFMRFPLELIFIDDEMRVTEIKNLNPWGFCTPDKACRWVLEIQKGKLSPGEVEPGDRLEFHPSQVSG